MYWIPVPHVHVEVPGISGHGRLQHHSAHLVIALIE